MNADQKYWTIKAMEAFGGGFESALAGAYARADHNNSVRIEAAFPEMLAEYGPGSKFYERVFATVA